MSLARALVGRHWLASASRKLEPAAGDVVLTRFVTRQRHARAGLAPWRARSWLTRSGEFIAGVTRSEPTNSLRRRSGVSSRGAGELLIRTVAPRGVVVTGRLS